MGLDTVGLRSPFLSESDAEQIDRSCVLRSAIELSTGEELYSLTTGSLAGSFDDRVSVRVEREEWYTETLNPLQASSALVPSHSWKAGRDAPERVEEVNPYSGRTVTAKRSCAPYLAIEGSVHKAMLGHNVYGAPLPPVLTCYWFVDDVARRLGLPLPEAADWTVQRIDWAEAYELPSSAAVAEFVRGLNAAQYPRRKAMRYGSESLMFPGRTTAWKCYHKGPEFEAHDRKRLRECLDRGALDELQQRADRVLRLETSIKSQKLVADFGRKPTVLELTETYLEETHDRETDRVLREGAAEVETVRTLQEVLNRLDHTYGSSLGRSLFGTWSQLSTLGEEVTRQNMSRPTFYRHRKLLDQAGCSWHGTDVMLREHSLIPAGFSPIRRDPRRLVSMADEVSYKLGTYSRAA